MRRDDVLRLLAEHQTELQHFGIRSLAIFGSVARDQAGPASDVDILVEFDRPVGYFELFDLEKHLQGVLNCPVDVFTPNSLREDVRERVLREAIRAA